MTWYNYNWQSRGDSPMASFGGGEDNAGEDRGASTTSNEAAAEDIVLGRSAI